MQGYVSLAWQVVLVAACGSGAGSMPDGSSVEDGDTTVVTPVIAARNGDHRVRVHVEAVAGATAYQVYRGTSAADVATSTQPIATIDGLELEDTSATLHEPWFYAVRAVIDGTAGPLSNVVQAFAYDLTPPTRRRSGLDLYRLAFGAKASTGLPTDVWVAVGQTGRLLRSTDGTTFADVASLSAYDLRSVTFSRGQFVAVGAARTNQRAFVATSPDGLAWSDQSPATGDGRALRTVASAVRGDTLLGFTTTEVAAGMNGSFVTSTDGVTFTDLGFATMFVGAAVLQDPYTRQVGMFSYPADRFFALVLSSVNGSHRWSSDGTTWNPLSLTTTACCLDAQPYAENDDVVGIGADATVVRLHFSFATNTITSQSTSSPISFAAPYAGGDRIVALARYVDASQVTQLVAISRDGLRWRSSDGGLSFTPLTTPLPATSAPLAVRGLVSANNELWLVGDNEVMMRSSDGASFVLVHEGEAESWSAGAYGHGVAVIASTTAVLSSTDGTTFTKSAQSFAVPPRRVVANRDGFWLAGGRAMSPRVSTSTDGTTWSTPIALPLGGQAPSEWMTSDAVELGGKMLIYGTTTTTPWVIAGTPVDGFSIVQPSPAEADIDAVWLEPSGQLGAVFGSSAHTSSDGVTWNSPQPIGTGNAFTQVLRTTFGRIALGFSGVAWRSTDDATWIGPVSFAPTTALLSAVDIGDHLLVTGALGELYTTTDGVQFAPLQASVNDAFVHAFVTDRSIVIVGASGTVLTIP